ncbi:hypothetical protein ACFPH8_02525 [Bizionia hallyeonensis]|uniref:asparagine synthase (glutamine-hydrolyzing) n=1 Tax=Bizionia hallyeonensis TaxID=1123757 RepID=A0ABW0C2M0_9FLAO
MFKKTIEFNNQKIDITIFDSAFSEDENGIFFGHPLGNLSTDNYNDIKGSWFKIQIKPDEVIVVTDIIGAYRMYYLWIKNHLLISDDYRFLLAKISSIEINEMELAYWKTHDCTTGGKTLFKGINKFKPATETKIKLNDFSENLYFKNAILTQNNQKHTEKVYQDLDDTFSRIKQLNKKVILMFSGGKDSCLLALFLKKHEIDFTPVFLKLEPTFNQAFLDFQKVNQVSKALKMKTEIISVKFDSFSQDELNDINEIQLLDKHFTPVHFKGIVEIKKRYGKEVLVLNGSTSDSIFTFGPSENSFISYLRRYMMFKPNALISKFAVKLLNLKTKKRFKLGETEDELLLALMDEYKYCRVLDMDKTDEYYDYLYEEFLFSKSTLNTFNSLEMYAKNFTFLQGSTQQIVHNSCRYQDLKYVMPFATPGIIYATMQFRDRNLEIKQPKYCVERILKDKFSFNYNKIKLNYDKQTFSYNLDDFRNNINEAFDINLQQTISKSNKQK